MDRLRGHHFLPKKKKSINPYNFCKSKYQTSIGDIPDILSLSLNGQKTECKRNLLLALLAIPLTLLASYTSSICTLSLCAFVCNEINDISRILPRCKKYASFRTILCTKLNIIPPSLLMMYCYLTSLTVRNICYSSFKASSTSTLLSCILLATSVYVLFVALHKCFLIVQAFHFRTSCFVILWFISLLYVHALFV